MTRFGKLAVFAYAMALVGCTATSHLDSQTALEQAVTDLYRAQGVAFATAAQIKGESSLTAALSEAADSTVKTPQDARMALGNLAAEDLKTAGDATNDLNRLDRISFLYRAVIKSWHAGSFGRETNITASSAGTQLCDVGGNAPRPDRDCDIFVVANALNAAETTQESLNEFRITVRTTQSRDPGVADVINLVETIGTIQQAIIGLEKNSLAGATISPVLRPFIDRQIMTYSCHALEVSSFLISLTNQNNPIPAAKEAKDLIKDSSSTDMPSTATEAKYAKLISILQEDGRYEAKDIINAAMNAITTLTSQAVSRGLLNDNNPGNELDQCKLFAKDLEEVRENAFNRTSLFFTPTFGRDYPN